MWFSLAELYVIIHEVGIAGSVETKLCQVIAVAKPLWVVNVKDSWVLVVVAAFNGVSILGIGEETTDKQCCLCSLALSDLLGAG